MSAHEGVMLAVVGRSRDANHLTFLTLFEVAESRADGKRVKRVYRYAAVEVCDICMV